MNDKRFISGDDAIAEGVRLSKPHVISAYPITPQTIIVEKLSEFVIDGSLQSKYMHVESEHSALSCAIGASSVGARTFTATSSQGLLYMAECLPYASGARLPIVMVNANRSLATPWNIYNDHMDGMFVLNSGWIQIYVEDAQEALDMIIQSYKIAETPCVMMPIMINVDGFVLTHTYELVEIPEQDKVDHFLPSIHMNENKMDLDDPKCLCITAGNDFNLEFRIKQQLDMEHTIKVIESVDREFDQMFGRSYGGMIETYNCDDAKILLITVGSITGTVRVVVDDLRNEGLKVGLIKLRCLRPFPSKIISELGNQVKAIGVIDKDISFGYEGTLFTNIRSALLDCSNPPLTINFIGGLGGRDITKENIKDMFDSLLSAANGTKQEKIQYINRRCPLQ